MIQSARRKEKENCDPHWDKEKYLFSHLVKCSKLKPKPTVDYVNKL